MAGEVKRGDVRVYRLPAPDKSRPVVVLTRDSAIGFLTRVSIAPITSTIRDVPTEVVLGVEDGMKGPCAVSLDNVVTVPRTALGRLVCTLDAARLEQICQALNFALGCRAGA